MLVAHVSFSLMIAWGVLRLISSKQVPLAKVALWCYQCRSAGDPITCITKLPLPRKCEKLHTHCYVLVVKTRKEGIISMTRGCTHYDLGNECVYINEHKTKVRCFRTCSTEDCNGPLLWHEEYDESNILAYDEVNAACRLRYEAFLVTVVTTLFSAHL